MTQRYRVVAYFSPEGTRSDYVEGSEIILEPVKDPIDQTACCKCAKLMINGPSHKMFFCDECYWKEFQPGIKHTCEFVPIYNEGNLVRYDCTCGLSRTICSSHTWEQKEDLKFKDTWCVKCDAKWADVYLNTNCVTLDVKNKNNDYTPLVEKVANWVQGKWIDAGTDVSTLHGQIKRWDFVAKALLDAGLDPERLK